MSFDAEYEQRSSRTMSDLRVVDMLLLAEGLWCPKCDVPISLKNCVQERRNVFSSCLWVSCAKCNLIKEFQTLKNEDKRKPLSSKVLANAKRLSFLSGQNELLLPQTLSPYKPDKRKKSVQPPVEKSPIKIEEKIALIKTEITEVDEYSDGRKRRSSRLNPSLKDAKVAKADDSVSPALKRSIKVQPSQPEASTSSDHEEATAEETSHEYPEPMSSGTCHAGDEEEETITFDWDEPFAVYSESDDADKEDSEEELFHQPPSPIPVAPILCEYCLKPQKSLRFLRAHLPVHPEFARFLCGWCGLQCSDTKVFERHRRTAHNLVAKYHLCQFCGKLIYTLPRFRLHLKEHDTGRPFKCPHCNWTFRTQSCVKKHLPTHLTPLQIQCEHCPKQFKSVKQVREHMRLHITGLHFRCKYCNTSFTRSYPYQEHMDNCHRFMCPLCMTIFPTLDLVRSHRTGSHTVEELERSKADGEEEFIKKTNHQCSYCHKYLYDPKSLRHHIQAVHLNPNSGYDINRRLVSYKPKANEVKPMMTEIFFKRNK